MQKLLPYLRKTSWDNVPAAAQSGFTPYQVIDANGADTGLFTGYFEPLLQGSFTKSARYCHPVYAPPSKRAVTRGEVLRGALENQNLELLYVDDAVDLFFAHVQGSAEVQMDDGRIQRIGFAAKSGHPYVAIGKTLKEMGALTPPITMHSIKAWLRANPERQHEIFSSNPSFIFFKLINGAGPIGASGEVLIPEQSLAVDDTLWSYGLSVIIATIDPVDNTKSFVRPMRTADTGSAIKGVIRGDIYFGAGDAAGVRAGAMNAQGRMWLLLPD